MKPRRMLLVTLLFLVVACGETPLQSVGDRSSGWINEPEVTTTTLLRVDVPRSIPTAQLGWSNDDIGVVDYPDAAAAVAAVFERREGDRFIQASRHEIVIALPELVFPTTVPYGAEWVSSQLVIENSGLVAAEPSAAFGIWSAEPYSRSRTVAQMAVLRVATDPETAAEVSAADADVSCARFAERSTDECALLQLGGRNVWKLTASGGDTLIWFEGPYRYELFGRSFVPTDVLEGMAADTAPLAEIDES
ncbi:MAG: hypothetical protein L0Z47_07190 [Actinobacteria bacterium]|nr:hypothetical protein [Actinomycetota bacterium]MCI0678772.1 hypothetical protein [Actinomycetota bacterium]